jgi:hypothetical protein
LKAIHTTKHADQAERLGPACQLCSVIGFEEQAMHPASRLKILRLCATFALVFGLLTIVSGSQGLFGGHQQKAALGNYVGFVLWFNFLAGFAFGGAY